jgi:hypothetical protein
MQTLAVDPACTALALLALPGLRVQCVGRPGAPSNVCTKSFCASILYKDGGVESKYLALLEAGSKSIESRPGGHCK